MNDSITNLVMNECNGFHSIFCNILYFYHSIYFNSTNSLLFYRLEPKFFQHQIIHIIKFQFSTNLLYWFNCRILYSVSPLYMVLWEKSKSLSFFNMVLWEKSKSLSFLDQTKFSSLYSYFFLFRATPPVAA